MSGALADRLFAALKHGDADHQAWLRDALTAFFAEQPIPVPRGSGNKEARIRSLEDALGEARLIVANLPHDESLFLAKIDSALGKTADAQ